MAEQSSEGRLAEEAIRQEQLGGESGKFRAASNVDVDREGDVVNGPFEGAETPNPVGEEVRDSSSLFLAEDTTIGPANRVNGAGIVQPGIAQPVPNETYIEDRDDIGQGGEPRKKW